MTGTKTRTPSLLALVVSLMIGGDALAQTLYVIDYPVGKSRYTRHADIAVTGFLGGGEMDETANVVLVVKLRKQNGVIQDSFVVRTDGQGRFSGTLDIDAAWEVGPNKVEIWHDGEARSEVAITVVGPEQP